MKDDHSIPARSHRRLWRKISLVALLSGAARIVGLAREMILSRVLGTSAAADLYRFIVDRVLQEPYFKVEKFLQPLYIPLFVRRTTREGEVAAWEFANVVLSLASVTLGVLSVLAIVFCQPLVCAVAPLLASDPTLGEAAISLTRVALVALVLYCLSNLLELTLQCYRRFTMPALAELVHRLFVFAALAAVAVFSPRASQCQVVVFLVWATVVAICIRFALQVYALRDRLGQLRFRLDLSNADVRRGAVLSVPLFGGVGLATIRNAVEIRLANSLGPGYLAALGYARKLVDVPWQVIGMALGDVLFPFLSELDLNGRKDELARMLSLMLRVTAFVFVPLSVLLLLVSKPVVEIVLAGGRFDAASVRLTLSAFQCYLPGMVFFAAEEPLLKWFFAREDSRTPFWLGLLSDLTFFAVMTIGVYGLHKGLPSLAVALALSKAAKVIVGVAMLAPRVGKIEWVGLGDFALRLGTGTVIVQVLAGQGLRLTALSAHASGLGGAALLLLTVCFAEGIFFLVALALRMREPIYLCQRVARHLANRRANGLRNSAEKRG